MGKFFGKKSKSKIPIRSPRSTSNSASTASSKLPSRSPSTVKLTPLVLNPTILHDQIKALKNSKKGSKKRSKNKSSNDITSGPQMPTTTAKEDIRLVSSKSLKVERASSKEVKENLLKMRNTEDEQATCTGKTDSSIAPIQKLNQQQQEKSNVADMIPRLAITSPINLLNNKILQKIFSFLNHSDLIICRGVQNKWNQLIISNPSFLDKTLCVVPIQKSYNVPLDSISYNDVTSQVALPFLHARFQYIDNKYIMKPDSFIYRNSDNERYVPSQKFLSSLTSLEFQSCFLYWQTIKRILVQSAKVKSLIITNCHVTPHLPPSPTLFCEKEFEDFEAGKAIATLSSLEINEVCHLKGITELLKKFTGFRNTSLATLKISYRPSEEDLQRDGKDDCLEFCLQLKELLWLCVKSLHTLVLEIYHEQNLDLIGDNISRELAVLGPKLNLKECQFTLSLGRFTRKPSSLSTPLQNEPGDITLTGNKSEENVRKVANALAHFLESQKNLERLAIPCIAYSVLYGAEFKHNFSKLPCANKLNFLAVPSAGFLLPEFLNSFPSLRRLKIGGSCCSDYTSGWEVFKLYLMTKEQSSKTQDRTPLPLPIKPVIKKKSKNSTRLFLMKNHFFKVTKSQSRSQDVNDQNGNPERNASFPTQKRDNVIGQIEELCISTCSSISEDFPLMAKNLSNLTCLEISSNSPVVSDEDLQICVQYIKQLRTLMIGCADNLTDYGITGIPEELCMIMFRNQRYHKYGLNQKIWGSKRVTGTPLSKLKGLRKLVLMGNSKITDVGIGYALIFQELKYCHLPYSDYIMEWGIQTLGEMNPSMETLVLSAVNQFTKEAFLKLRKTHKRMKRGDASRSGYFVEKLSPLMDDFSLVLPPPPMYLSHLYDTLARKILCFISLFYSYEQIDKDN